MRARPYRRVCVYIIVNQITLQHGMMANSLRMKHCANERRGNEPFKLPISISIYIALRVMDGATTELNNKVMPSFHAPRVQWIPLRGGGRANGTMELMRRPGGINRLRRCSVLFFFLSFLLEQGFMDLFFFRSSDTLRFSPKRIAAGPGEGGGVPEIQAGLRVGVSFVFFCFFFLFCTLNERESFSSHSKYTRSVQVSALMYRVRSAIPKTNS